MRPNSPLLPVFITSGACVYSLELLLFVPYNLKLFAVSGTGAGADKANHPRRPRLHLPLPSKR